MPLTPSQIHRHTNIFENEPKSALVTASPEELEKCRFTTPTIEPRIHEIKTIHRKIYIIGDEDENNEKT